MPLTPCAVSILCTAHFYWCLMWEPVVRKKRPLQSDILTQKSGHGPKHAHCWSRNPLQHAEHPPGSQQVHSHHFGFLWRGGSLAGHSQCHPVVCTGSTTGWAPEAAPGQLPGQQRLLYFNISIQLSHHFSYKVPAIQSSNTKCLSPTRTRLECRPAITWWSQSSEHFASEEQGKQLRCKCIT